MKCHKICSRIYLTSYLFTWEDTFFLPDTTPSLFTRHHIFFLPNTILTLCQNWSPLNQIQMFVFSSSSVYPCKEKSKLEGQHRLKILQGKKRRLSMSWSWRWCDFGCWVCQRKTSQTSSSNYLEVFWCPLALAEELQCLPKKGLQK